MLTLHVKISVLVLIRLKVMIMNMIIKLIQLSATVLTSMMKQLFRKISLHRSRKMLRKSEITLLKKIAIFLFGLSNIIPSKISIYDQYIIPLIEKDLTSANPFFTAIKLGIVLFRILIIVGTAYEIYDIIKYAKRNK